MRAEELLDTLTDEELKKRANGCFIQAENTSLYEQAGPEEKQRLLAQADVYLKALTWRQDARIAERDFRLEKWVIALISVEIVLSLIFGGLGLWQGYKQGNLLDQQTKVLTHMDASTATTATAMQTAAGLLQTLSADQATSRDILQTEQAYRLSQLAKKPKLVLYVGNVSLAKTPVSAIIPARQQTDTSVIDDLMLKNEGSGPATQMQIRVVLLAKDVFLQSAPPYQQPIQPPDISYQTFLIPVGTMRPNTAFPFTLTFTFPKGHAPFNVQFKVDADQIETATLLGQIDLHPPNP